MKVERFTSVPICEQLRVYMLKIQSPQSEHNGIMEWKEETQV